MTIERRNHRADQRWHMHACPVHACFGMSQTTDCYTLEDVGMAYFFRSVRDDGSLGRRDASPPPAAADPTTAIPVGASDDVTRDSGSPPATGLTGGPRPTWFAKPSAYRGPPLPTRTRCSRDRADATGMRAET